MQSQNNNDNNKLFAKDEFKQEVKEAAKVHTTNITVNKDSEELFAQDSFKSELKEATDSHKDTTAYLWEEHRSVARDAAALAGSKSGDFAKAAEGESSGEMMDKEMLLLKDRALDTLVSARLTLEVAKDAAVIALDEAKEGAKEAYDLTKEVIGHAYDVSKEKTVQAYEWTADKFEGIVEEVKEKSSEALEFLGDKMKLAGDKMIDRAELIAPSSSTISQPMHVGPLSTSEFKDELKDAALEHNQSAGYQWEAHKGVARDAAVLAASKSEDFAKAVDGESESAETYIEIAKEKIGETVDFAKEKGMLAFSATSNKIEGVLEGAKEKTGEALEYIGSKMTGAGGAMMDKGLEAQDKGIELQDKAAAPTSV